MANKPFKICPIYSLCMPTHTRVHTQLHCCLETNNIIWSYQEFIQVSEYTFAKFWTAKYHFWSQILIVDNLYAWNRSCSPIFSFKIMRSKIAIISGIPSIKKIKSQQVRWKKTRRHDQLQAVLVKAWCGMLLWRIQMQPHGMRCYYGDATTWYGMLLWRIQMQPHGIGCYYGGYRCTDAAAHGTCPQCDSWVPPQKMVIPVHASFSLAFKTLGSKSIDKICQMTWDNILQSNLETQESEDFCLGIFLRPYNH